jgi:tetratricopeptide (TPR) repeat protein
VCSTSSSSSTSSEQKDIVNRKIGVTDYAKFEQIAKEIEREDVLSKKDILNAINPNDIKKAKQVYEGSTKPKVEASVIFKNEGDYYLKRKLYENAVDAYEKALLQLFYTFNDNEEDKKVVETKKCAINLNLSMALMNLGRYKDAVGYLQEAKRLDMKNLKTIYRMSYCYFKMDNIDDSFLQNVDIENLDINAMHKIAIEYSDAVVFGTENVDPELIEFVEAKGLPYLTHEKASEGIDAYNEIYNSLIEDEN